MRILHITTLLEGSAGRIVVDLAREQQRLGHEVTVVTLEVGGPEHSHDEGYLHALSSLGISTQVVGSRLEGSDGHTVETVSAIDRLVPADRESQVVHTHATVPSAIALRLKEVRQTAIGVIQTLHDWEPTKTPDQAATDIRVLNLVDRVAVPSPHSATLLEELGVQPAQIAVVPYGVSTRAPRLSHGDEATWIAMARARRAGRLVVVCVGTYGARTNQALLVEALARIERLDPLCVFIGDGDDRSLRQLVDRHGCNDCVRVHGYSRSARALAAGADLLVLPSRSDGQPISVLDAFSDGLLVATSNIPEFVGLVDHEVTGFLFRSEDVQALAETLMRVARLSNSDRRVMRAAARSRYASDFTLHRMVEHYSELYATLRGRQLQQPRRRVTRTAA